MPKITAHGGATNAVAEGAGPSAAAPPPSPPVQPAETAPPGAVAGEVTITATAEVTRPRPRAKARTRTRNTEEGA